MPLCTCATTNVYHCSASFPLMRTAGITGERCAFIPHPPPPHLNNRFKDSHPSMLAVKGDDCVALADVHLLQYTPEHPSHHSQYAEPKSKINKLSQDVYSAFNCIQSNKVFTVLIIYHLACLQSPCPRTPSFMKHIDRLHKDTLLAPSLRFASIFRHPCTL